MRRLIAQTFAVFLVASFASAQAPEPRAFLIAVDAMRTSIRALAEQTTGTAVFSSHELDAALIRLSQP